MRNSRKNKQKQLSNPAQNKPKEQPARQKSGSIVQTNAQNSAPAPYSPYYAFNPFEKKRDIKTTTDVGIHGGFVLREDKIERPLNSDLAANIGKWLPFQAQPHEMAREQGSHWYYMLRDAAQHSPTKRAIIRKTILFTVGKGFSFDNEGKSEAQKQRDEIFSNQVLNVLEKVIYSKMAFGEAFILQTESGYLEFLDLENVRLEIGKNLKPARLGYSPFWKSGSQQEPEFSVPIYPQVGRILNKGADVSTLAPLSPMRFDTVYRLKNEESSALMWSDYADIATFLPAVSEYYRARVCVNNWESGNLPKAIAKITGEDIDDDSYMQKVKMIEDATQTIRTAGGNLIFVPEDVEIVPLSNTGKNEGNSELYEQDKATIIQLHQFTPTLAGVAIPGKLGNANELENEYEMVQSNLIEPLQEDLLKYFILPVFSYYDAHFGTTLVQSFLGFNSGRSIKLRDKIGIEALTGNEMRTELKLPLYDDPQADIPMFLLNLRQTTQTPPTI
jgi:hypothetical protein